MMKSKKKQTNKKLNKTFDFKLFLTVILTLVGYLHVLMINESLQ